MPAFNKRGPLGEGPMSGKKMGACTRYGAALREKDSEILREDEINLPSPGIRAGRGQGLGRRNRPAGNDQNQSELGRCGQGRGRRNAGRKGMH